MKTQLYSMAFSLLICTHVTHAQGTALTYQGRLSDHTSPAAGSYDLRFTLYDASVGGNQQGSILTQPAVPVSNGLFTVTLDFGAGIFTGADRWLEIATRTNGASSFAILSPRQQVTPAPYAITAGNVSGVVPSSALSGSYSSAVSLNNPSNLFTGSGAGLANLNASTLTGGTVSDARLSTNVAFLRANQTFTGTNIFSDSIGIGPLPPIYPLDVFASEFGIVHEDGAVALATYLDGVAGWFGTTTTHPLYLMVANSLTPNLAIDTNGFVGINTDVPDSPLTVSASGFGLEHTDGDRILATYLDNGGGWVGTVSIDPLNFFVNNNANSSLTIGTNGYVGLGVSRPTRPLQMASGAYCSAAGSWVSVSDRNVKDDFTPIDPRDVLARVAALPITQWKYKTESAGVKHLGPMAQDFHAAFGLGDDDKAIATVDESGVALAAIQGLNRKVEEQRVELKSRDAHIADLEKRLAQLEALLAAPHHPGPSAQ